jgi:hypothetical protein
VVGEGGRRQVAADGGDGHACHAGVARRRLPRRGLHCSTNQRNIKNILRNTLPWELVHSALHILDCHLLKTQGFD